ncbi:unnamed protein product [Knipowitschia caucasica]
MAPPVKLRIVLGENDSQRLHLEHGIPDTIDDIIHHIKRQCGLEASFRLQFLDVEFGNEFTNLTSVSEIQDKGTLKLIFDTAVSDLPSGYSTPQATTSAQTLSPRSYDSDRDLLSSPDSTPVRASRWPVVFTMPQFPYDCELQLDKANANYKDTGTLLNPDVGLKTAILDGLSQAIVRYKVYPSDREFEDVAEALVASHPCLKEPGSSSGYSGWKVSLKYKLANYRRKLKQVGCPEVELNSLTNKPADKCTPAYGVKKPRKAEVNYFPSYPAGDSAETLEKIRENLILEASKRDNNNTVTVLMEKTFALRRQEVIRDAPLIPNFKSRWPALFSIRELSSEFKRITTISLQAKFFSELDGQSSNLMRVFASKGGAQGKKIQNILVPLTKTDSIDVKRECLLKALCLYLNEEPHDLVKEYLNCEDSASAMLETTVGIFVIRKEQHWDEEPECVGIIIEGVEVLTDLQNMPLAVAMLLALVYSVNLSYPPKLKYTFEAIQKLIMELDGNRPIQALKTQLAR